MRLSLRLERRRLQLRAWRKARDLRVIADRTSAMARGPVLFSTMRNEAVRLPFWLDYYRRLGVGHFLIVDNGSNDDTVDYLTAQADVSLWQTDASYRKANYGVDWMNALLARHGRNRWILCIDPDEFLVYPHCDTRPLPALIRRLEQCAQSTMGAFLIDMYGADTIGQTYCRRGEDPCQVACWFDGANYVQKCNPRYYNLWIQGGPRMRTYFADQPAHAPALNKIPLVFWRRGYVFVTSTHNLLPRHLNRVYVREGPALLSGALLHVKFMDVLSEKVAEEMSRGEHYSQSREYKRYATGDKDISLWTPQSIRYRDWQQLEALGLIARGGWN